MKILIYEDGGYENLYPLSMLRAVFDLRCGANTIKERIDKILNYKFETILYCRSSLSEYLKEIHTNKVNKVSKDDFLLINGRMIFSEKSLKYLTSSDYNQYYIYKDEIIGAYIGREKIKYFERAAAKNSDKGFFGDDFFEELGLRKKEMRQRHNNTF